MKILSHLCQSVDQLVPTAKKGQNRTLLDKYLIVMIECCILGVMSKKKIHDALLKRMLEEPGFPEAFFDALVPAALTRHFRWEGDSSG